MAAKPVPSSDEIAYQAAIDNDFQSAAAISPVQGTVSDGSFPLAEKKGEVTDTTGFIGVSPEYMNYSSDLLKPGVADGGVEEVREKRYANSVQTKVSEKPAAATGETIEGTSTAETLSTALAGKGLQAKVVEAPKFEEAKVQTKANLDKAAAASSTTEDTTDTDGTEEGGSAAPATPKTPSTPAK